MIEFPFEEVDIPRGVLLRPKATVRFIGPSESLHVECLIDSGEDVFDRFNIEFRQLERKVLFYPRDVES